MRVVVSRGEFDGKLEMEQRLPEIAIQVVGENPPVSAS
jgi:hypothetical protein